MKFYLTRSLKTSRHPDI